MQTTQFIIYFELCTQIRNLFRFEASLERELKTSSFKKLLSFVAKTTSAFLLLLCGDELRDSKSLRAEGAFVN